MGADSGLPDIDGVDVCRRIRAWSQVPIVVLSAEASDYRKVLALDEGADDYVTKPFSMPELLAGAVACATARPRTAGARRRPVRGGDLGSTWPAPGHRRRAGGRPHAEGVRLPRAARPLARPGAHPPRRSSRRCGAGVRPETHYLRVYASQIRKKLGDDPRPAAPRHRARRRLPVERRRLSYRDSFRASSSRELFHSSW